MRGDRNLNIFILAACMAAITLAGVLVGYSFGASAAAFDVPPVPAATFQLEEPLEEVTPTPTPVQIAESPIPSGSISVLGFERLTVEGRTLLAESVTNPAQNACYIIISFMLSDGTEVYRSGILAPGQTVGAVELSKPLTPGAYEGAVARYSCYALETMQPRNGADITFTLEVSP